MIVYYIDGVVMGLASIDKSRHSGFDITPWFNVEGNIVTVSKKLSDHEELKIIDEDYVFILNENDKIESID